MNLITPFETEIEKGIIHLKANDKCLSTIIKLVGNCNLSPQNNYFDALIETIISQQLSAKAASSIYNRFCKYFANILEPRTIIETEDGILRGLGISGSKIKYLKDLSDKVSSGMIDLENIFNLDEDSIIKELTRVKGIGVWSVQMFLIFSLGKLNVLPVNDLGIRKAIMQNYNLRKLPDEKKIKKIAKAGNWEPYCSIASWYLWRSLDNK